MPRRPGSGRKPKPVEQRIREGVNVSHRPMPQPVLVGGRPMPGEWAQPPEDLPEDGKKLWREDVSRIIEVGIADRVDTAALESLCIAYARAKQAGRVIKSEGLFISGSYAQLREHPAVRIEAQSWDRFLRLAEQFGITPISRTRLGLAELGRRTLQHDLEERLGQPNFKPVPAQNGKGVASGQVIEGTATED